MEYAWPEDAEGTVWEEGAALDPTSSSVRGGISGADSSRAVLRASTVGGAGGDGAARARRQAELRKQKVLAAGGQRLKQVSGQEVGDAGSRKKKKRGKRRMPAFLRNAHMLEPKAPPDAGGAAAAMDGPDFSSSSGSAADTPSMTSDVTAASEPSASLRASTADPSATTNAKSRRSGVPASFSSSLRKRSRKQAASGGGDSQATPQPAAWEETRQQPTLKSTRFCTPAILGHAEFFSRTAILCASGALFGRDVLSTLSEFEAGDTGAAHIGSDIELLTQAMEEQPTNYVVIFVFILCCTVTCTFATIRMIFFPMVAARRSGTDLPEVKIFDAAQATVRMIMGIGGSRSSLTSGLSLVWQILSAMRSFFDDVCVFAIGLVCWLAWARSGVF